MRNKVSKKNSNISDDASGDWDWSDNEMNLSGDASRESWDSPTGQKSSSSNYNTGVTSLHHVIKASPTGKSPAYGMSVTKSKPPSPPAPRGMQLTHPSPPQSAPSSAKASPTLPPRSAPAIHTSPERTVVADNDLFQELGLSARPTFSHAPAPKAPPPPVAPVVRTPVPAPVRVPTSSHVVLASNDDTEFDFDDWNEDDDLEGLLDD